jgi:hypothetical protein
VAQRAFDVVRILPRRSRGEVMTTAPITRALRKSTLIEYKILERDRWGKILKVQEGWRLTKHEDHVVVSHSAMNSVGNYEFTTAERTTDNYPAFIEWLGDVSSVLREAGLNVELARSEYRWGSLKQHKAKVITKVKVK